ncbi:hypothetical protein [Singulisphaera acidiphila]|uniref:Uncharacterized protein n=1 Tax=Singulisphaera acidiphila (strain ATCC BAA-1392 / DSM 18658 / VKM B-2454 / MOB10) TaxID=886293 RepID=L0DEM8_SINAD|nr:hypothetical protein [Singulisphaera acidiphila]AGA27305.1 hypothetical protein Sinac_3022 [Singulisphaera acidiphila DSM 18658]
MRGLSSVRGRYCLAILGLFAWNATRAEAGWPFRRRERAVVATVSPVATVVPVAAPRSAAPLGTFSPTPVMTVRGNYPVGGGYTPADSFGDSSMDIYGPLSSLRATSAPVLTYSRGYDGRSVLSEGTSFSTPNLPSLSPVIYPTQATDVNGPRQLKNPPWWPKATNWLDQN